MPKDSCRQLIWIPIVHTQADLGSMAEEIRQLNIQKVGRPGWERHGEVIEQMWNRIRRRIAALDLSWNRVRLYQDGLPNCGHEREIVHSLAQAGSVNHQLLLELVGKGATLVGTESPELLLEEYEWVRRLLASLSAGEADVVQRQQQYSQELLQRRDRYIAERIQQTLAVGETGLVFLGMLHVLSGLPADIEVLRQDVLAATN